MAGQHLKLPNCAEFPTGTVTFLFTDIEGSTSLLKKLKERYTDLLNDHHHLMRAVIAAHGGREVDTQGDAFFVVFPSAAQAIQAAVAVQKAMAQHVWPQGVSVRVRMGLHTGEPWQAGEGYVGMDVHRAARIAQIGHGGQVLLSQTTAVLVDDPAEDVHLVALGTYRLKDIERPEPISQLIILGLPHDFPPLWADMVEPARTVSSGLRFPSFLDDEVADVESQPFFAREGELTWLRQKLVRALDSRGTVLFITGEAGAGKTALIRQFLHPIHRAGPDFLAVVGQCNAYAGMGDPFLPFRQVLDMLTGDVESHFLSGTISRDNARRLWQALPDTAAVLADTGQQLLYAFGQGAKLVDRLGAAGNAKQAHALQVALARQGAIDLEQVQLIQQFTQVLLDISRVHPLVIVIDDLQWTDTSSANLLFNLGRRIEGYPILLIGAYRAEEVEAGRGDQRHPLAKVLSEFKRYFGSIWLHLDGIGEQDRRDFVHALVDSECNQLDQSFREALFQHTDGHALFTIELLQDLKARGALRWYEGAGWVAHPDMEITSLPPRVEGIIEERIDALPDDLVALLRVAAVEGDDFTVQVVAQVLRLGEREIVRQLSQELDKKHRLVRERGELTLPRRSLYRFGFVHHLFQQHLYDRIGEIEKRLLHEDVGSVLETLVGDSTGAFATQLAFHFTRARNGVRAVPYLLQAGDRARLTHTHQEAADFYQQAIKFLTVTGDSDAMARAYTKLGINYENAMQPQLASEAYRQAASWRRELAAQTTVVGVTEAAAPPALRLGIISTPLTTGALDPLDPLGHITMFFASLIRSGPQWDILPDVAQHWEMTEDGRQYIFHLRKDMHWSDGEPVTAHDFAYGWLRILDPDNHSYLVNYLLDIEGVMKGNEGPECHAPNVGIQAVDDFTLAVRLKEPIPYFLQIVPTLYPAPRHAIEQFGHAWASSEWLVSNGPWMFDRSADERVPILVRNPGYGGDYAGNVRRIEWHYNPDPRVLMAMYEHDELDWFEPPAELMDAMRRRHPNDLVIWGEDFNMTVYLEFNTRRPPFTDPGVRRAFCHAIDRRTTTTLFGTDICRQADGGFIPPAIPGYSPGIGLDYHPDKARRLLADSGFPNGRGFPQIRAVSFPAGYGKNDDLVQQWHDVLGVTVSFTEATRTEVALFLQPNFDLYISPMGPEYPDPDAFMRLAFDPGSRGRSPLWHLDEYSDLVERARRMMDHEARMDVYRQADRLLMQEAFIFPVIYYRYPVFMKPWLKKINPDIGGWIWTDMVIEPH